MSWPNAFHPPPFMSGFWTKISWHSNTDTSKNVTAALPRAADNDKVILFCSARLLCGYFLKEVSKVCPPAGDVWRIYCCWGVTAEFHLVTYLYSATAVESVDCQPGWGIVCLDSSTFKGTPSFSGFIFLIWFLLSWITLILKAKYDCDNFTWIKILYWNVLGFSHYWAKKKHVNVKMLIWSA